MRHPRCLGIGRPVMLALLYKAALLTKTATFSCYQIVWVVLKIVLLARQYLHVFQDVPSQAMYHSEADMAVAKP